MRRRTRFLFEIVPRCAGASLDAPASRDRPVRRRITAIRDPALRSRDLIDVRNFGQASFQLGM
jgi:hypothetical protein